MRKFTNFSTPEDEDAVVVNCPMMISALLDGSTIDCQPNKYFLMAKKKKKKKFLYRQDHRLHGLHDQPRNESGENWTFILGVVKQAEICINFVVKYIILVLRVLEDNLVKITAEGILGTYLALKSLETMMHPTSGTRKRAMISGST